MTFVRWCLALAMTVTVVVAGAVSAAAPAAAVGSYDNAALARIALGYVGQGGVEACRGTPYGTAYPGQCKQFVNCIVYRASGGSQRPGGNIDYVASFLAAGGVEVNEAQATVGDIVQWGSGATARQHTAIVVENRGGGVFRLVDSNSRYDLMVRDHVENVRGYISGYAPRFVRMGTPLSSPPPPADRDGDGVADAGDLCPDEVGLGRWWGCQESAVQTPATARTDVNGDGRGDYCRVVGGPPSGLRVSCSLGGAGSYSSSFTSGVIDIGYRNSYAWADVTGDGKADYCRLVGGGAAAFQLRCSPSTGSGFAPDRLSGGVDPGYPQGRAWTDVTGDGRADYCRVVGMPNDQHVQCTIATSSGFGATVTSPALDWGYTDDRWWTDVNQDRKADFCRIVGGGPAPFRMACTLSTGSGFGATWVSGPMDVGYAEGRAWVDVNGDRRNDYCRVVGMPNDQHVRCTLSGYAGFGGDTLSPAFDWGYSWGRWWADVNGDLRADYCRATGDQAHQFIACTLSTGGGFGATWSMGPIDWGYAQGRAWVDQNGDGRADYCRVVGMPNDQHVRCTLSGTAGFAGDVLSPRLDWGYDYGRLWAGGGSDGIAAHPLPAITPSPVLTGSARVGGSLTCVAGSRHTTWFGRQWLVGGQPRTGATGPTLALTPGDLGRSVSCRVSAGDVGLMVTATSPAVTVGLGPALVARTKPTIAGKTKVGAVMRVTSSGTWTPRAGAVRYQWLKVAGGRTLAIKGATGPRLTLSRSLRGWRLAVRVTATTAGHPAGSARSVLSLVIR